MAWDIQGKTAVVTGANSGIGKETAVALAESGARVVVTARDPRKGEAAVGDISERTGSSAVELAPLDLASFASVRACAEEVLARCPEIHVLVNNAGGTWSKRRSTEDGYEMTFQVNHLGPFLLTHLLLERLGDSAPARIVNVSSVAHRRGHRSIDFDDLDWERRRYSGMRAYNASKLCNVFFTRELTRRLEGTGITANVVHPGFVATNFSGEGDTKLLALGFRIGSIFARSPAAGADTVAWLAASPELEGVTGGYFVSRRLRSISRAAHDDEAARRLWEVSEELVGLSATT